MSRGEVPPAGFLVAFEGGEGAGKSTQAALLTARLRAEGREVVATREPGGSPIGPAVRALLLDPARVSLAARTEALLFAAERSEHVAAVIGPALGRGAVVVCDRFIDSSVAYQGVGRGLDPVEIIELSAWATDGVVADLTVLLDVDPAVGFARFPSQTADRIERESAHFHRRVAQAFRDLADANPQRYLVLDASLPVAAIAALVRAEMARRLGLLAHPASAAPAARGARALRAALSPEGELAAATPSEGALANAASSAGQLTNPASASPRATSPARSASGRRQENADPTSAVDPHRLDVPG